MNKIQADLDRIFYNLFRLEIEGHYKGDLIEYIFGKNEKKGLKVYETEQLQCLLSDIYMFFETDEFSELKNEIIKDADISFIDEDCYNRFKAEYLSSVIELVKILEFLTE
jgi:hypothetical protein